MDPRPAVVARRLAGVRRVVAVTGGKGGIGKTSIAVGLALSLREEGGRVGLLDLDLWGPSDHVVLGVPRPGFREDGGLVPDVVAGLRFMSIASIIGERPALLRGEDLSNAILELLAVTIWGELEVLVVDMPPGFGDTLLDAARYLPRAEYVVVTTPSELTLATTRKTLELLRRLDLPIVGLVENFRRDGGPVGVGAFAAGGGERLVGAIGYDGGYEASLGDLERLRGTAFFRDVQAIATTLTADPPSAGR
jgi:ATP-binding protein involved in chromosome partitioning